MTTIITQSKHSKAIKDRNTRITDLFSEHYIKGETQITPICQSIAKKEKVSLSTVKRLVRSLI